MVKKDTKAYGLGFTSIATIEDTDSTYVESSPSATYSMKIGIESGLDGTINGGWWEINENKIKVGPNFGLATGTADPSTGDADGDMYYNTSTDKFMGRVNGSWTELGGGGGLEVHNNTYHDPDYTTQANVDTSISTHTGDDDAHHVPYTLEVHDNTEHDPDYLANIVEDTTPQLGGDLDVLAKAIKSSTGPVNVTSVISEATAFRLDDGAGDGTNMWVDSSGHMYISSDGGSLRYRANLITYWYNTANTEQCSMRKNDTYFQIHNGYDKICFTSADDAAKMVVIGASITDAERIELYTHSDDCNINLYAADDSTIRFYNGANLNAYMGWNEGNSNFYIDVYDNGTDREVDIISGLLYVRRSAAGQSAIVRVIAEATADDAWLVLDSQDDSQLRMEVNSVYKANIHWNTGETKLKIESSAGIEIIATGGTQIDDMIINAHHIFGVGGFISAYHYGAFQSVVVSDPNAAVAMTFGRIQTGGTFVFDVVASCTAFTAATAVNGFLYYQTIANGLVDTDEGWDANFAINFPAWIIAAHTVKTITTASFVVADGDEVNAYYQKANGPGGGGTFYLRSVTMRRVVT